jgi:cytochrome d ubiquinol oxidase subunit II
MEWYLPVIWAGVIGGAVAMYVILDGFDLGLGILFPFAENDREREQMMASVKPFWDGNETWLVLGGGGLLVAFPLAYSIIMPAFYIPIVLGGMIQGVKIENGAFAGGAFDWATPFAAVCALGVATGYALLGATWMIMKTEGAIAERAKRQALYLLLAVLVFMGIVSLWTPLMVPSIAERWFSVPNIFYLWPVPVVTAFTAYLGWIGLRDGRDALPFISAIGLFLLGYMGLAISWFPYLVPPSVTVWDAAAAPVSQMFMLVGTLILLPFILGYTALI